MTLTFKDAYFGNTWLENIHEVAEPQAISWVPHAPFWWFLCAVLFFWGLYKIWQAFRRWQHNGYRRSALKQLQDVELRYRQGHSAALQALPELVRRAALHQWPRAQVVGLSDAEWIDFLRASVTAIEMPPIPDCFYGLAYEPAAFRSNLSAAEVQTCLEWTRTWINHHRAAPAGATDEGATL